jgi:ketosteroid isomerase-like protein
MSQENVEIVNRLVDAYNRRDREAVGALLHPEVEWHTLAGPLFGISALHGRDEMLSFLFEQIPEGLEDFRVTVEAASELSGGQVLVDAHYDGRGLASGAKVEMGTAAIYRIETGKIVFFQDFETRGQALEAAGLRE